MGCRASYVPLGEIAKFESGGTPSKKNKRYWDGSIPWISAKTLVGDTVYESDLAITKEGLEAGSKLAPKGSLLLLTRGSGLFKRIPLAIAGKEVAFNQDIKCVNSAAKGISNTYHFYARTSLEPSISAMLETTGIGAGKLATDRLKALPVPVLDEAARDKVTHFADCIYRKIHLNTKLNGYLEELAALEFSRRFGEIESSIDLGKVLSISTKTLKPQNCHGEIWEHYSIPAYDANRRPVFELADGIKSNKYVIDANSILISRLNPSIRRIWMPACSSKRAVCSTEFIVYKPKNPVHKAFYYAAIGAPAFRDFLLAHVTGSTGSRQRAQPKATLTYPIPNPGLEAVEDFCAFANPLYEQIKVNERNSKQLEELRDALLPKLMTGEIDVSKLDLKQLNSHLA